MLKLTAKNLLLLFSPPEVVNNYINKFRRNMLTIMLLNTLSQINLR